MNFDASEPQHPHVQDTHLYDPAIAEEAAFRSNPEFAKTDVEESEYVNDDPSSRTAWNFATTGIAGPEEQIPEYCNSPEGSDSDSDSRGSMRKNIESKTPPESPYQTGSPGPAPDIERLKIHNSDNRTQNRRGRPSAPGTVPVQPKRSASSELSRPAKASSPQQNARASKQRGQNYARGLGRYPRQTANRPRSGAQYGAGVRQPSDVYRQGSRHQYPIARDSGYDTMESRQNTLQQALSEDADKAKASSTRPASNVKQSHAAPSKHVTSVPVLTDLRYPNLIMQPESSPISQEQLAAEVKGIYGGLVMVEAKCINIDAAQAADPTSTLGPEQWQALIALHRTLLYEHHDFLMATQHPSATPALKGLAQKYSMPARMWRHGIHAFLEVLRHRRPESHDYMLSFIYLAYQMMALLSETVETFEDTWIECLGDLARYRMAIEEEKEAHSIWGGVAARWYNKASDRHPAIGRLYHHLGILERPSLWKVCLYAKSLTCVLPFPNARDSMATLYGPLVQGQQSVHNGGPLEAGTVAFHAHLFMASDSTKLTSIASDVLFKLKSRPSERLWQGCPQLIVSNIAIILELGSPSNQLWLLYGQAINAAIQQARPSAIAAGISNNDSQQQDHLLSLTGTFASDLVYDFAYSSFNCIAHRAKNHQSLRDFLPSIHIILVWFHSICILQSRCVEHQYTIGSLWTRFSWGELVEILNLLIQNEPASASLKRYASQGIFPGSGDKEHATVLREDNLIHGLIWCQFYFPTDWFNGQTEEDGRDIETPMMHDARVERILWLGLYLTFHSEYLRYDETNDRFYVPELRGQSPVPIIAPSLQIAESDAWEMEAAATSTATASVVSTSPTHSDSDGFVLVDPPKRKSRGTYASIASKPNKKQRSQSDVKIVDDGMQWEVG